MKNYYHLLGVEQSAPREAIRAAFKKLAVKYHPDKTAGDPVKTEIFKELNEAYHTLMDPYKRVRYDFLLQYGYTLPPIVEQESPYRRHDAPPYKKTRINSRENWIATGYAWAFTFIIAMIAMVIINVREYYYTFKREQRLVERRELFEKAKSLYASGNVHQAISLINGLGVFLDSEEDMLHYKNELYKSFILNAENLFERKGFEEAIYYYELIETYMENASVNLKEHQAHAYRMTNRPHKSIKKLKELLILNFRTAEIYLQLAEIHRDHLNQISEAIRYFELANTSARQTYRAVYGEGYPFILDASLIPSHHYRLYTGLADIYLQAGDPERAVKAIRWNVAIWPDSVQNYVTGARAELALNHIGDACAYLNSARSLGFKGTLEINCE